jgi:hypothetical protein|tara:strand:+ start:181 stop:456 length:276 start_codon:yes stop_codon:yes gene_type:complete
MSKWSEPNNLPNIPEGLVGSKHTFPDGDSIMIFEIKLRDRLIEGEGIEGITPFVTYEIQQGPGIPRRHTMSYNQFLGTYGHLFPAMSGKQE